MAGTITNFGFAAGALAIGGPYWGVIAFLGVALVRLAMDAQSLRHANETLRQKVESMDGELEFDQPADERPPQSGTRTSRTLLEKRAS